MRLGELSLGGRSILLVDDDEDFVEMMRVGLSLLGCDIHAFTSAAEARDAFEREPARYHAVISDVCMPGISGIELAQVVRGASTTIPVILISGLAESIDKSRVDSLDVEIVLTKPVTPRCLAAAVIEASSAE